MENFPNDRELIAISALLLLPIAVVSEEPQPEKLSPVSKIALNEVTIDVVSSFEEYEAERSRSISSDSKSTDGSWLSSDCTSGAVQAKRMEVMSAFTAKLKNLRRSRSKVQRRFHGHKIASRTTKKSTTSVRFRKVSETASDNSCVSSSRSDLSSGQSRKDKVITNEERKQRVSISQNIRQRAGNILNLLSRGCSSEVRIRQVLGDSPDTSKALRILLKASEIKRSGAGGRADPYIYKISE